MTIIQILQRIRMLVETKNCDGLFKLSQQIDDLLLPQEERDALNAMVNIGLELIAAHETLDEQI